MNSPQCIANVERLHAFMDRDGVEVLVARSGANFTYLAGFDYAGTLARHLDFADSPRAVLVIWPRHGDSILVVNRIAAPRARRDSWITSITEVDDYGESAFQRAANVLADMGLGSARIGIERRFLSVACFEELSGDLDAAEYVDVTEMMDEVRWIKTEAEIGRVRDGARILDEAMLEVFPSVRAGEPESALHARIIEASLRKGANWAHGILNSSRNTVFYGGESDFTFRTGDVVRNDYVLWYRGYPGHQSRTVVIGEPTAKRLRDYERVRDIYRATVAQARPGVRACDVYAFAANAFREEGFEGRVPIAGHSIGAWWHQQSPFLVPACDIPIEAGMVLAFEPHVNEYHIQDMFLITADGQELLSPEFSTEEMLVVG